MPAIWAEKDMCLGLGDSESDGTPQKNRSRSSSSTCFQPDLFATTFLRRSGFSRVFSRSNTEKIAISIFHLPINPSFDFLVCHLVNHPEVILSEFQINDQI